MGNELILKHRGEPELRTSRETKMNDYDQKQMKRLVKNEKNLKIIFSNSLIKIAKNRKINTLERNYLQHFTRRLRNARKKT